MPYEQKEFEQHIKKLMNLQLITETQSPHRTRAFIVNKNMK